MRTVVLAMLAAVLVGAGTAEAQQRGDPVGVFARSRGWLGFSFRAGDSGWVTVTEVREGTPASEAGLEDGDVIVRWNGREDVAVAIADASLRVGDTVEARVRREGEADRDVTMEAVRRPFQVTYRTSDGDDVIVFDVDDLSRRLEIMRDSLAVRTDSLVARAQELLAGSRMHELLADSLGPRMRDLDRQIRNRMQVTDSMLNGLTIELSMRQSGIAGAELTQIGPGLASYFDVDEGVLVLRVAPDTPAARAGLQEGDVIVRAGGEEVGSVGDVRRAFGTTSTVVMEIVRRGNHYTLRVGE